ncbi:RloB family protein [Streptomyces sp. NBC_00073]|uniref:RloB family protein n=1 Tax=Streptomyces sp. NBC_00073 TaxID=2975640 RepID=UPI003256310B
MARTRGKDSLTSAKPKGGKRRRVVHVFTEGKVTEPEYIAIVRARGVLKDPGVQVDVHIANESAAGSHRKPIKLVEDAVRLMREEVRAAKRSKLDPESEFWPQVWCLFDRDEHEQIEAARKQAREAGVQIAFSHPCFELWRLLHVKTVDAQFGGACNQVTARLPFAKNTDNIKHVESDQIPENSFKLAKQRAQKINSAHGEHVSWLHRDPYTDVFEFVEKGLGITAY